MCFEGIADYVLIFNVIVDMSWTGARVLIGYLISFGL